MEPSRDQTHDPWICSQTLICSQTRYQLRYTARYDDDDDDDDDDLCTCELVKTEQKSLVDYRINMACTFL